MPTEKKVLPKTWEEFCKITNRDPKELPADAISKRSIADFKLSTIILWCNKGILPDYTNYDQTKYEPWWELTKDESKPSGFGLSYGDCDCWGTHTSVGPRFAFLDSDDLRHVTKYFIADYEDLLL